MTYRSPLSGSPMTTNSFGWSRVPNTLQAAMGQSSTATLTCWVQGPEPASYSQVPVPAHSRATDVEVSSRSKVSTPAATAFPPARRASVPPFPSDHVPATRSALSRGGSYPHTATTPAPASAAATTASAPYHATRPAIAPPESQRRCGSNSLRATRAGAVSPAVRPTHTARTARSPVSAPAAATAAGAAPRAATAGLHHQASSPVSRRPSHRAATISGITTPTDSRAATAAPAAATNGATRIRRKKPMALTEAPGLSCV